MLETAIRQFILISKKHIFFIFIFYIFTTVSISIYPSCLNTVNAKNDLCLVSPVLGFMLDLYKNMINIGT